MNPQTYRHRTAEVRTLFAQDEAKIERWEKAGLYSIREVTDMLERLKSQRDWLLASMARELMKGGDGEWAWEGIEGEWEWFGYTPWWGMGSK